MSMISKKVLISFLLLSLVYPGFSQVKQLEVQTPFPFSVYQLKNGLTVILSEDSSLPLVSVVCAYKVGSAYEKKGESGLAYLLENLMFMGSKNVGPMQHIRYIHRVGGELNAVTSWGHTLFYQTVSSNQLPLVLWLESDRMKSLDLNYSNVEGAKNSMIELIRSQKTNDPFRDSFLEFDKFLYPEFAYNHPIIGNERDLRTISLKDVVEFYDTFYKPNNAVLCITGNIEKEETLQLVKKYFQTIDPSRKVPPGPSFKSDFKQIKYEKVMTNEAASIPGFRLGYRIDSPFSNDFYILTMIDYLLFYGNSSRLYRRLVIRNKLALRLNGGLEKRIDLAAFKFFVFSNNEATKEIAKKALFSELNRLKSSLIPERELKKIKNIFESNYIDNYYSTQKRALFLTRNYLSLKNIDDLPKELDRYLRVSASDIIGIMNRYFTENYILIDIKVK